MNNQTIKKVLVFYFYLTVLKCEVYTNQHHEIFKELEIDKKKEEITLLLPIIIIIMILFAFIIICPSHGHRMP